MSNLPQSGSPELSLQTVMHIVYGLFAVSLISAGFLGLAAVAGVILLYVKRQDFAATYFDGHAAWLLATFWWSVLALAVSFLATLIYIGWLGVFATVVWALYRIIRGWLALVEGRSPVEYE
ncbi:DUF4870 family protein [Kerstersia similis]|uniref:DUF4870 family protein n=1 Tax=Kerstersia similis TaxID=206505 RepID=UPI0039F144C5